MNKRIESANKIERQKIIEPLIKHLTQSEKFRLMPDGTMVFNAESVVLLLRHYSNTGEIKNVKP